VFSLPLQQVMILLRKYVSIMINITVYTVKKLPNMEWSEMLLLPHYVGQCNISLLVLRHVNMHHVVLQ
jgi:hypothetical protein